MRKTIRLLLMALPMFLGLVSCTIEHFTRAEADYTETAHLKKVE